MAGLLEPGCVMVCMEGSGCTHNTAIRSCFLVRGDMNCDGYVNSADVNPFVTALVSQARYERQYPNCRWLNGDVDGNGHVTFDDTNPFVECLVSGGCS